MKFQKLSPALTALQKHRGPKSKYRVLEDNDPTGYKSNAAIAAKHEVHIEAVEFPRYSPDLNPLDFSLWEAISSRMWKSAPSGRETVDRYKVRLRRTAMRLPTTAVRKAIYDIPTRMRAIVKAKGGNIAKD